MRDGAGFGARIGDGDEVRAALAEHAQDVRPPTSAPDERDARGRSASLTAALGCAPMGLSSSLVVVGSVLIGTLLAVAIVVFEAWRRMNRAGQLRNASAAASAGFDRQESLRLNTVACATAAPDGSSTLP